MKKINLKNNMEIIVNGTLDYFYLFTRKDENFPSVIRISECTVE